MALIHPLLRDASEAAGTLILDEHVESETFKWVIERENGGQTSLTLFKQISRASLSLDWIDPTQPVSRFFTLRSRYLGDHFQSLKSGQSAWLTREAQSGSLYVIENAAHNVYTMTRLRHDISISDFVPQENVFRSWNGKLSQWWEHAKLEHSESTHEKPTKRIKLDMSKPEIQVQYDITQAILPSPTVGTTQTQDADQSHTTAASDPIFENFVCQYLDALYLSKTSLAFFAKGPLSRVRALFSSPTSKDISIFDLALFLRSMIIPLNALDKKFREKLPALAEELALKQLNDDEPNEKKKSRKKKRLKINREGMYPFEEGYVENWWKTDYDTSNDNETREVLIKRRVGDLRVRQTLIQIILLLEIMALEASSVWKQLKQMKEDGSKQNDKENPKRAKKPVDLDLTLDLLVDKLSLWQSIEVDSQQPVSGSTKSKNWSKDVLGGFCVDVLVPFFKSKVPLKAAQIVKRFGGPNTSPEKTKAVKKLRESKTEGDSKRDLRKPLSRSTSQSQSKPLRPGSISRSVSDLSSIIPSLKREGSEARSLSSVPVLPEKPKPRRDSMASLKHLKSRQISLSALNAPTDRKRKREVKVEEELKSAIDGIKKPNRSMIGRQVTDEREKIKFSNHGRASKVVKMVSNDRKALGAVDNVQILATPHHNRTKHMYPANSRAKSQREEPDVVTSSAIKPQSRELIPATEDKKIPDGGSTSHQHVLETPSRGIRQYMILNSPDNMISTMNLKKPMFMESDVLIASSPMVPASTRAVKTYPKYAFGRPMPIDDPAGLTSPSKPRLLAVPATPIKKS